MKVLVVGLALGSVAVPNGHASENKVLKLRPKAAIEASVPRKVAPFTERFTEPLAGPELDLLPRREVREPRSPSSCAGDHALCYDAAGGHLVYKPAHQLMPDIPGLHRENISIKRHRITFRYTF